MDVLSPLRPFSRRRALRLLGGASVVTAAGVGLARTAPGFDSAVEAISTADAPKPQTHEIVWTASEFDWPLMDDTTVRAWGYNGTVPGPELRVREGDRVKIELVNQLPVPTTIHWHGVNVPNNMDGVAGLNQAPVQPGSSFIYDFIAKPAGTRWYHSHTDPALQIAIGLYGSIVIEPASPQATYDREYTYILAEWDAELTPAVAAGTAPRGAGDKQLRGGELGSDFFLMNGRMHGSVPPIVVTTGDQVLIRLINAGNLPHAFHIHGHSFQIVATDGNPIPEAARWTKDSLLIGPSERYDIAFTADNPGVWMVHCHMEHHMANGMMTLLAYEGYKPTGPAAEFYGITGSATPEPSMDGMAGMDDMGDMDGMAMSTPELAASPAVVEGSTVNVAMVDDRLVPSALTISAGTTVIWTNQGQDWHDIASLDGSFDSSRVSPGDSFSHQFDTPGVYQYVCKHHFLQGMTGTITVT